MMSFLRFLLVSLAFTLGTTNFSHAASFNCSKATTETEIAICNDPELSVLDERLSKAYQNALRIKPNEGIKIDQLSWISLRELCATNTCIKEKYLGRLNQLEPYDYFYENELFASEPNCKQEDRDYASGVWNDYYDPELALRFGLVIQKILRNKDIEGLLSIIPGELNVGFRKQYASSQEFSNLFETNDLLAAMSSPPSCSPVGWRGFLLGNGQIWYNCSKTTCGIFAVVSKTEEKYVKNGWIYNGTIHPKCFSYPWTSDDNFEEISDFYQLTDYDDFRENPGKFLGKEISNLDPITPTWCSDETCEKVSLVGDLNVCMNASEIEVGDNYTISAGDLNYRVVDRDVENCKTLLPHLDSQILICRLVVVGEQSGGSMGTTYNFGIYAHVQTPQGRIMILPLKFFKNLNTALNFLDKM